MGRAFGFSEDSLAVFKVFYNNISSRLIINNTLSDTFKVGCSVRQGCPLSPLLYTLQLEPFLRKVRSSVNIRSISLPAFDISPKVFAFADDSIYFLRDTNSVNNLMSLSDDFGKVSGSKVNRAKSKAMWLGIYKGQLFGPFGFKWVDKLKFIELWF